MLSTSTQETNIGLPSGLNKVIDTIDYHKHSINFGLKLLQQGISETVFYLDLLYKFKIIVAKPRFSVQFRNIIKRYKK